MRKGSVAFSLSLLIVLSSLPLFAGQASSAAPTRVAPFQDLLFTDVSRIEDVELLGESGYVAATRGGLVVWTGEAERRVVTRTDGLPSNLVWDLQMVTDGVLAATESGLAKVDLGTFEVTPVDHEGPGAPVLADHTIRVQQVDGELLVLDRDGELARQGLDGTWTVVEGPEIAEDQRATDAHLSGDRVLIAVKTVRSGIPFTEVLQLNGMAWERVVRLRASVDAVAYFDELVFAGLRGDGVRAFELDGRSVDVGVPPLLANASVERFVTYAGELWVGSTVGLHIYTPGDGTWRWIDPRSQLPHSHILDAVPLASLGAGNENDLAVVGTPAGLGWPVETPNGTAFLLHRTLNGPISNTFFSASLRTTDHGPEVWFGTDQGASLYYPEERVWWHIGPNDGLHGAPVYSISHEGDETWLGTRFGAYGLDRSTDRWRVVVNDDPKVLPGNIFYDAHPDGKRVWMPELGNGLLMHDKTTGEISQYHIPQGLLSPAVTCSQRWHEFLAVCSDQGLQFFNLTQANDLQPLGNPFSFCDRDRCGNNYPTNRTFVAQPDGARIWAGTIFDGVLVIQRDLQQRLTVAGHWNTTDGLPADEVRSIALAPGGLWVGTVGGLARIDLRQGVVGTWTHDDGLDDDQVNGLVQVEDILYIATLSGVYRLDVDTGELLALVETEGVFGSVPASVRVAYPPEGAVLKGPVTMTGTVQAPGRTIERVEVSLDGGAWVQADGRRAWTFPLPVDSLTAGTHTASVRVIAGDDPVAWANRSFEVVPTPVEQRIAPTFEHTPPKEAVRGDVLVVEGTVAGEDPLYATLEATIDGEPRRSVARIAGDQATFTLRIPDAASGQIAYQVRVQSGGGEALFPAQGVFEVPVKDPRVRSLSLVLEGTDNGTLELAPGETRTLTGWLNNSGNRGEAAHLQAVGTRSSWVTLTPTNLFALPGAQVGFEVKIRVPDAAAATPQVVVLTAGTADGTVTTREPLTLRVLATDADDGPGEDPAGERGLPVPGLLPLLAVFAIGALLQVRRGRS